jgi:ABC-type uncharacterized transport system substrate-binding protein
MTFNNTVVEEVLKNLLQKKVSFEIDKKIFKTGRIILFSQHYFFISFIMNTAKKKQEKTEIPIPFNIEIHKDDNLIYFDYRLSTLAFNNKSALTFLQDIPAQKNKFLNKILTINIHNE